jgi:hypothetical protein
VADANEENEIRYVKTPVDRPVQSRDAEAIPDLSQPRDESPRDDQQQEGNRDTKCPPGFQDSSKKPIIPGSTGLPWLVRPCFAVRKQVKDCA